MYGKTRTRESAVQAFRNAAGLGNKTESPDNEFAVWSSFWKEYEELCEAGARYTNRPDDEERRADFLKEWADVQYTLSQIAVYYDIPADVVFNRVHESNMTKVSDGGKIIFREDGKILKPDTYQAPNLRGL